MRTTSKLIFAYMDGLRDAGMNPILLNNSDWDEYLRALSPQETAFWDENGNRSKEKTWRTAFRGTSVINKDRHRVFSGGCPVGCRIHEHYVEID